MRKHLVILAAFMTAIMITACGNGDGIVINGTTAADSESSAAVTEEGESETSQMAESTNGAKIEIITGETEQGAGTESAAESLEGKTENQTTQAPTEVLTTSAPKATAAPTTAAPKATTAASTTAAQYEVKDVKKTMYATSSVRVRSSYSTNSEVLGALGDGEKIEVTGESSNGWMRVNYNGHTAYVSKSYLTDTKPTASTTAAANQTTKPSSTVNSGTTPGKTPGPSAGTSSSGSATGPGGTSSSNGNVTGPGAGTSSGGSTGPGGSSSSGTSTGPGNSSASSGSTQSGGSGTVTGTVIGLDPTGVTVQTGDGTSYQFVWGSDVPALSTGEKVQISYGVDSSGQRQIKQVVK